MYCCEVSSAHAFEPCYREVLERDIDGAARPFCHSAMVDQFVVPMRRCV